MPDPAHFPALFNSPRKTSRGHFTSFSLFLGRREDPKAFTDATVVLLCTLPLFFIPRTKVTEARSLMRWGRVFECS